MGKRSSRLAMIQQKARGSKARPRDRAKPTEQHMAQPTKALKIAERDVEEWDESRESRHGAGKEEERRGEEWRGKGSSCRARRPKPATNVQCV